MSVPAPNFSKHLRGKHFLLPGPAQSSRVVTIQLTLSGLRSLRHHHDTTIKSNANLGRGRPVGKPLDLTLSRTHGDRRWGNPLKPPEIDHSPTLSTCRLRA
uniref:(northern house mosquito) hypothetical protein n=1 Tax=Culex pipiens TaxID=7175 RepID=A0A8D8CTH1_CULPI